MALNDENNIVYQDFIGFTFSDIHSSTLNLKRVNDSGNRYNRDLVPTFQDKTVQVAGRDGTYLFGSYYTKREITINVAFDSVTEEELVKIKNWGADKKIHKLILDEEPYKYYNAKLANPPQLKYLCFDESNDIRNYDNVDDANKRLRVYKGEGTFKFVCYEPFARGTILSEEEITNKKPDLVKVVIDKNQITPIEIEMPELEDISNVQLFLCSDLYGRGNWGIPDRLEDGSLAPGQIDNYGNAISSYLVEQPQKTIITYDEENNKINLSSNYQTYLYPVDFEKGFLETAIVTNGKIISKEDSLYDYHLEQRRTEIVQYDPRLKATYDISSKEIEEIQEEYGVYKIIGRTIVNNVIENIIERIDYIEEPLAKWENNELVLTEVAISNPNLYYNEILTLEELKYLEVDGWTKDDFNKYYIIEDARNTNRYKISHSIYLLPNDETYHYTMECRYINKDKKEETIYFDISIVNSNEPSLFGESFRCIKYYSCSFNNYNEWKKEIGLPKKQPKWNINHILESYNSGDFSMPFLVDYKFKDYNNKISDTLYLETGEKIKFENIVPIKDDVGIVLDTNLRIIRGYSVNSNYEKILNNNIYNRYIVEGDFFYIPSGEFKLHSNNSPNITYEYRYL